VSSSCAACQAREVTIGPVARGYLEGPASEEREAALERGDHLERKRPRERRAVYGSTAAEPEQHFIGWADDVDPDELFASGRAWGLSVRLRPADRGLM
jgi:hypothetical protein